ncbi:MAG: hypothetical protein JWN46_2787 [Acidimicrobiales bacterium]|nr:hypothetical protein [Acidimicrobiales bacterium]
MTIGASVFLIAVGAILRFAVTDTVRGIDLAVVGVILMVAGAIGLLASLMIYGRRDRVVVDRPVDRRLL